MYKSKSLFKGRRASGASARSSISARSIASVRAMERDDDIKRILAIRLQKELRFSPDAANKMAGVLAAKAEMRAGDPRRVDLRAIVKEERKRIQQQMERAKSVAALNKDGIAPHPERSSQGMGKSASAPVLPKVSGATRKASIDTTGSTSSRRREKLEAKKIQNETIWGEIVKYNAALQATEEEARIRAKAEQKAALQAELERQVEARRRAAEREKEEEQKYAKQQAKDVERWRREQAEKARRVKEASDRQKEEVETARQYRARQQDMEKQRRMAEEAAQIRRIHRQRERQLEAEAKRKEEERKQVAKVKEDNDRRLEDKRRQLEADKEEESRLAREYAAMEERKEAQRLAELKSRADAIAAKMALMDGVQKDVRNREAEDAARAERERLAYERKRDEELARKHRKVKSALEEQRRVLAEQVKQKQEKKRKELEEERAIAKKAAEAARENLKRQERDNRERARRRLEHKQQLEQQIAEQTARKAVKDESGLERQINRRLLGQIDEFKRASARTDASSFMGGPRSIAQETRERAMNLAGVDAGDGHHSVISRLENSGKRWGV